jgi:uncharacterized membrane protein
VGKERLTAFTDGVVAIIITILVLELKVPRGPALGDLAPLLPSLASYVLSFVYVGIYWNNHHHMLHLTRSVTGPILWANMHLLFWLSLTPFATAWVGQTRLAPAPIAVYGGMLMMTAVAYTILSVLLIRHEGPQSSLAQAIGHDIKGKLSLAIYAAGVAIAFVQPLVAFGLYVLVAVIWFLPDPRIERTVRAG